MTLTAAPIGDNPQITSITSFTYLPDQLIAGNLKLVTSPAAVSGAGVLPRGTVLGQKTTQSAEVTRAATNTGNGTGVGAQVKTRFFLIPEIIPQMRAVNCRPVTCNATDNRAIFGRFLGVWHGLAAPAKEPWRTGWDSNPRNACTFGGFQDRCLKPLGHLSIRAGGKLERIALRRQSTETQHALRQAGIASKGATGGAGRGAGWFVVVASRTI
jgi:hypothetical protein